MSRPRQNQIQQRLKSKSLLWYAGIILIILGIIGIAYGVFVFYNGLLIKNFENEALDQALAQLGMTHNDGMYALIGFGSAIILLYVGMLGAGILGFLSAGRILRRRTLFWYAIVILSILVLFTISNVLERGIAIVGILGTLFYAFSVYKKFNDDLKSIRVRKTES